MTNKFSEKIDRTELKDIKNVKIDTALPCQERIKSYIEQLGNPYVYLDGDMVVEVSFADTEISLQERLKSYACSLN